ncbi:MAG: hypothetical protein FJZ95_07435 [Chloroflexi bacterium]|nr:hypothetical protein [Chloroflexota bacterium]
METALAIAAIVITSLTLAYVVWNGERQVSQLSAQIKALCDQPGRPGQQASGEACEEARIRDLQFFLPAKAKRPIAAFEGVQKENEEVALGKEVKISKRWETELHVRFELSAPQHLTAIRWGFGQGAGCPEVIEYRDAFAIETVSKIPKEIFKDRHGYWHIRSPFAIPQSEGTCSELAFTVKGDKPGRFPLEFEIGTNEGQKPFKEALRVEVTD